MDVQDRVIGSAVLKYDFTDWLYIQGRLGTDFNSIDEEWTEAYGTAFKGRGDYRQRFRTIRENNADVWIGAAKNFTQ